MKINLFRKKTFRRLIVKVKNAKEELDEAEVMHKNACKIFMNGISAFAKENNLINVLELLNEKPENTEDNKSNNLNEVFDEIYEESGLKQTWKKTIAKTHPDKGGNPDHLDKLVKAKKEKDFVAIFELAKNYDVDIPDESFTQIEVLENQLKSINQKIKKIHNSLHWLYFISESAKRVKIIQDFFRSLGVSV